MTALSRCHMSSANRRRSLVLRGLGVALLVWGTRISVLAADSFEEAAHRRFADQAAQMFRAARTRHLANTNQTEAAWQFARAAYDLAEYATNGAQRAALAEQGIEASREVIAREPTLAAGHYYLGMNFGQLARTRTFGALKLVDQMETVFLRARELDPHFSFAGPDRHLGMLYREAPGWPTSIGSETRARQHLLRAALLEPEYPGNRLNLAESFVRWGEPASARRELEALNEIWPKAQVRLAGEEWESSWAEWEKRRAQVQRKLDGTLPKDQILKRGRVPQ
jgi:hypothetical protein